MFPEKIGPETFKLLKDLKTHEILISSLIINDFVECAVTIYFRGL